MPTNDYRNTRYCPSLQDVGNKKQVLEAEIKLNHPRQKIMYNKVRNRDSKYNKKFCKIYNDKCAYCGVSMDILPSSLFEIDHFVAETQFRNKEDAGKLENLVLSCYQCNRNKKEFEIFGDYIKRLNTDDGKITNVFYRDDQYYIRIKDDFIKDKTIKAFYDKLRLINQTRRLDYLLINMNGLYEELKGTEKGRKLSEAILIMQKRRNKYV